MVTAKVENANANMIVCKIEHKENLIVGKIEQEKPTIVAIVSTRNRVPSNYGLITWDGSILTVS